MKRALAGLVLLLCADAGAAEPRVEADRLTELGARAYGRGDYAGALELFHKSFEIYPSPSTHSNLARALLKLERRAEAMEEFEAFLAEATGVSDDAHAFALAKKAELAAQLGKLTIECDTDGAEVTIDSRPAGRTPLPRARWVVPGAHFVTVAAPGRPTFDTRLQLGPGELRELHAVLQTAAPQAESGAPPSTTPPPSGGPPPAAQSPSPWAQRERAGRWMTNLKLGFSPAVYIPDTPSGATLPIYFTFSAEIGFALCCQKQLYIVFPFSLQYKDFGNGASTVIVEVPLGVQYDIHLIAALYLPIQLSVGFAAIVPTMGEFSPVGIIRPSAGLKYVIAGRGNVGIDLFSLPILFNDQNVVVEYRMMFYGGVIF